MPGVKKPKNRQTGGMSEFFDDFNMQGPSQGDPAAAEQGKTMLGRGTRQCPVTW
jgi:hypothetical protein